VSLRAVPVIFPVRYALHAGELRFALVEEQLARALHKSVATLQADGFEEDNGRRWTAFAVGPTERIEGPTNVGQGPPLAPGFDPIPPEQGGLFRLQPVILSGRWIETL